VQFGQSVSALRQQTDTAFSGINTLVEDDAIERAGGLTKITEQDVRPVLSADTIHRFRNVFDDLQAYTNNLAGLISPDRPKDFEDALQEFGQSLTKVDRNALPSPGVSAAVQELGRILVQAKAQRDAVRIARMADPAVQRISVTMAEAISAPRPVPADVAAAAPADTPLNTVVDVGMRQNVANHWSLRLKAAQTDFATAAGTASVQQKQQMARAYVELLGQRDAELLALDSLHQSFLQLGQAHAALARGEPLTLQSAVNAIKTEVEHTRELFDKFEEAKKANKKKEGSHNG
jgi:hypothetical protein